LRITNQTDEETVDDREDGGKIVSETEQANRSPPSSTIHDYGWFKDYFAALFQLQVLYSVESYGDHGE
jgi:hypothetical protein